MPYGPVLYWNYRVTQGERLNQCQLMAWTCSRNKAKPGGVSDAVTDRLLEALREQSLVQPQPALPQAEEVALVS